MSGRGPSPAQARRQARRVVRPKPTPNTPPAGPGPIPLSGLRIIERDSDQGIIGRLSGQGNIGLLSDQGSIGRLSDQGTIGRLSDQGTIRPLSGRRNVGPLSEQGIVGRLSGRRNVGLLTSQGIIGRLSALLILAVALMAALVPAPPAVADGELARAREAREAFLRNVTGKKRGEWTALVKRFEEAAKAQPKAEWAAKARFEGAQLAWRAYERFKVEDDAARTAELARAVVKGCSRCPDAPAAQTLLGRALMARGRGEEAYRELMKVALNYHGAPEIAEAEGLMIELEGGRAPARGRTSPGQAAAAETAREGAPPRADQEKPAQTPQAPEARTTGSQAPETRTTGSQAPEAKPAPRPAQPKPPPKPPPERPAPKAPSPRADGKNQLYGYRLDDLGGYSEVTAHLERVVPHLYNLLPPARDGGRFRIYVDLKDTVLAPGTAASLKTTTPLVRLVKVNQLTPDTVRLVADLPSALPYAPVFLDNPPRLVLRVASEPRALPPTEADEPPTPRPVPPPKPKPKPKPARGPADSMARQLGLNVKRVVIDPGHGGKDGGAAAFGLKEKDIVLAVALKLKTRIEARLGLEVVLTRTTDKFVTLDRRAKIALDQKADLFVSLHVNANDLPRVHGLETYLLNFTTDPAAMAVAARENAGSGKSMAELRDLVQRIATNTRVAESRVLAKALHSGTIASLRSARAVRDLGVKEAAFLVLANVEVPAVLVEMGFITNQNEAKLLASADWQDRLAEGLVDGLAAYLEGLP